MLEGQTGRVSECFSKCQVDSSDDIQECRQCRMDGASRSCYRQLNQLMGLAKSTVFMVLGAVCVSIYSYFGFGICYFWFMN